MSHEAATTVRELPEALPAGERILWQGAPRWQSLLRGAFHGRTLAVYFAVILLLRGSNALIDTGSVRHALVAMLYLLPLAVVGMGMVTLIAWLTARATYYTITDKRLVMRMGVVLEITFNFPFKVIEAAGLRLQPNGTGDIPVTLGPGDRIAYLHLWPHVRPWHFKETQPMLRSVPQAELVADLLARAMAASTGGTALPVASLPVRVQSLRGSTTAVPAAN